MYPIKANKLKCTSKYGNRSYTYKGKKVSDYHRGIDLVANPNNRNEEILAFADGQVTSVQKTGAQYGTGCYVRIKHSNGYYTLYYHLKSGSIVVNKGDKVKKGQKIGIIGTTGQSTGVHLHFQIDKGSSSSSINPYDYVFGNKILVPDSTTESKKETTTNTSTQKFKIGDQVVISGNLYKNANATTPSGTIKNKTTKITRYSKGSKHPYNTIGDIGWIDESSIRLANITTSKRYHIVKKGDTLWDLAIKYYGSGSKYKTIKSLNNLSKDKIYVGQKLRVK